MAEINDTYGSIYQNLIDSGCDIQTTKQCISYMKEGRISDMLSLILQYKSVLLASVHTGQKRIDCLDFLIYKLKNYNQVKEK